MLNSMFVDYVNSGASIFFPDLPYTTIAFNFTTSHLIDIVIFFNVIAFLQRTGYHYYVNVCLKRTCNDLCLEPYYLESYEAPEETSQDLNLIYGLKNNSEFLMNEQFDEHPFSLKRIFKTSQFIRKSRLCSSTLKKNFAQSNFLHHFYKNNTIFQKCSVHTSTISCPAFNKNRLTPTSFNNIYQKEGI